MCSREIALVLVTILCTSCVKAEEVDKPSYTVKKVENLPAVDDPWDSAAWARAETLTIATFHPRGSDHQPLTEARLLHNGDSLAIVFRVQDRFVIAKHANYQDPTHKDSCVEFFAEPKAGKGYFNFEMNAAGTLLLWYVEDPKRIKGAFAKSTPVPVELAEKIEIHASFPEPVENEIPEPTTWTVSYRVPRALFEDFVGDLTNLSTQRWRGNFYKCADDSSHPHWGYWADIGDRLDFHQPKRFAPIIFE